MIPYSISIKYMVAGYLTILSVLTVYLGSLIIRWHRLAREMNILEKLDRDEDR